MGTDKMTWLTPKACDPISSEPLIRWELDKYGQLHFIYYDEEPQDANYDLTIAREL